ncbi:uncharacterized protein LOC141628278 [Silene latifolia]|uniref:uncharacterized protein LOC141628278 n=1 Tax=Silene latifolia TaxID=37657 RepID=UPI003D77FD5D
MSNSEDYIMTSLGRTKDRRVTSSKRRIPLPLPPRRGRGRGRGKGIEIRPSVDPTPDATPEPVMTEMDFPSAFYRQPLGDSDVEEEEHFDHVVEQDDDEEEEEEEEEEEDDDSRFLDEEAAGLPPKKVVRDGRGRYVPLGDGSSSSTGRKKTKTQDNSWRLTGPVEGGPSVLSVLRSFGGHVAYGSWTGQGMRSWITCYERPGALEKLSKIKVRDGVMERVSRSGLGHLRHSLMTGLDENLISAFVERWQPDTNTFHMPFGEITILLHDVEKILGIRVDGMRVMEDGTTREEIGLKGKVATLFGLPLKEVKPPLYKGGGLTVKKLIELAETGNLHDSPRAYMMCDTRYMSWYRKISHPHFYPPARRTPFRSLPMSEEPEVSRALSRHFSQIYRQPTKDRKWQYARRLVEKMDPFFRAEDHAEDDAGDDDDDDELTP